MSRSQTSERVPFLVRHSFRHSSRHELKENTGLKCTHRTISNYFDLCSNYVVGNVFFWKKWTPKPKLEVGGRVSQDCAGPGPFTRTLEKPQRDMLNKRTVGDIVHC